MMSDESGEIDENGWDGPSRSQQRREALDVLAVAKALFELSDSQLAHVPLSDDLRELVVDSRKITAHIARKRQMQFLAKHLRRREEELPAIRAALDHDKGESRKETAKLHRIEQSRDRLLEGGDDAINLLMETYPDADRQRLRQLVRRANEERRANKPPAAARELFKALRDMLEEPAVASNDEDGDADIEATDLDEFDFDAGDDTFGDDSRR